MTQAPNDESTLRFDVREVLGEGGAGVVHRAIDRLTGETVALKTVRSGAHLAVLKHEFRVVQGLHHPNLVQIRDLVAEGDDWLLSMEYVDGVDLLRYVQRDHPPPRAPPCDEQRLRLALRQLAAALAALHQAGRVHRDVKPANVLVTREGRVVVLDFGIAVDATALSTRTEDGDITGTALYMAPEQVTLEAIGPAADWYALGVVIYHALTRRFPFEGATTTVLQAKLSQPPVDVRSRDVDVPGDLADLCMQLLSPEPAARPGGEEVLARLGASGEAGALSMRDAPPLLGRARELGVLRQAYADVRAGFALTVVVQGESGVGKSVIAKTFAREILANVPAPLVFFGRCYEREAAPFKAFGSIVDELATYLAELPDERVSRLLPDGSGLLPTLFPDLARVGAIASRKDVAALEPSEARRRIFGALRDLVRNIGVSTPMVLVVDDLQWADADSFEFLAELTRAPLAPPILLVCTMRVASETIPRGTSPASMIPEDARFIVLDRLGPDPALRFVEELCSQLDVRVDPEVARGLVDEAGGHPMFLAELVRERARMGATVALTRLDDALRARVSRLPPAARRLLEVVCLAGLPIAQQIGARAAALGPAEPSAIAALRAELLVLTGGVRRHDTIEPYHDRIREAVAASVPATELASQHGRIALALEQDPDTDAEMLSRHWLEAGNRERAAHYAVIGADRASGALAFERAARLYESALGLMGPGAAGARDVEPKLADALTNAGRWTEAAERRLAMAQRTEGQDAMDLRRVAAEQLLCSGQFDRGIALLEELLRSVGVFVPKSPVVILLCVLVARLLLRIRGLRYTERDAARVPTVDLARTDVLASAAYGLAMTDHVVATYFTARCGVVALDVGEPHRLVRSFAMLTSTQAAGGRPGQKSTRLLLEATQELAGRTGTAIARGLALQAEAWTAYLGSCSWTEAKSLMLRAEAVYRDECVGAAFLLNTVRSLLYRVLTYRGDLVELEARLGPVLREADALGDVYAATNIRAGSLVWVRLAADRPDLAGSDLAWVAERLPKSRFLVQHWYWVNAQAMLALYRGHAPAALDQIESAWSPLSRSMLLRIQNVKFAALDLRGRAHLAVAATDTARRAELLARAATCAKQLSGHGLPYTDGSAALLRAGIARVTGDRAATLAQAEIAHDALTRADMALSAAAMRYCLGSLVGGDEGATWVAAASARLENDGVLNVPRFVAMVAPGLAPG